MPKGEAEYNRLLAERQTHVQVFGRLNRQASILSSRLDCELTRMEQRHRSSRKKGRK
jgi:hypothetical protein